MPRSVKLRELVERDPRLRKGVFEYYLEKFPKRSVGTACNGGRYGSKANGAGKTHHKDSALVSAEMPPPPPVGRRESAGLDPMEREGGAGDQASLSSSLSPSGSRGDARQELVEYEGGDEDEASPSPSGTNKALSSARSSAGSRKKANATVPIAGNASVVSRGGRGRGKSGGGGDGGGRGGKGKGKKVVEVVQEGVVDPPDIVGLGNQKFCGVCLGIGGGKGSDLFLECRK